MNIAAKGILNFIFKPCLIILLVSCRHSGNQVHRGFYYWKTNFEISAPEKIRLEQLKVQKLYIRFFDVNIDPSNEAVPVAKFFTDSMPQGTIRIIPVVFITNKTMDKIGSDKTESLAWKILSLVDKTALANNIPYDELQVDCDWTPQTKDKYFSLLGSIRKRITAKKISLSCTIRLHQVKYYKKTGIPPVDRGMLMFYNMGKIEDTLYNSIFNSRDASRYVASIKNYPLALDVALPVFSWVKHYREGRIVGLINEIKDSTLQENPGLVATSAGHFRSSKNMFLRSEYLQKDDLLVVEEMTPSLAKEAAELLQKNFPDGSFTVVLYHWDTYNLSGYENKDLEAIYHCFE